MTGDPLRLVDVLTTATSIASYLGAPEILPTHLLDAIRVLRGEVTIEALGPGLPPIVPRPPGGPVVREDVQLLARQWFARLEGDITAVLTAAQVTDLISELRASEDGDTETLALS